MPFIDTGNDLPGILSLLTYRPDTGRILTALANALLVEDSELSRAEREAIAARVSTLNRCEFCARSHSAVARVREEAEPLQVPVDQMVALGPRAVEDARLSALLRLAEKVADDATTVTAEDVDAARRAGASDRQIHDTVLIAAAFCMYNRYVDGLGTSLPPDPGFYEEAAQRIVRHGYGAPS
ncbi:MAG: carboxymuconolactone decarboxylase [Acidimicrobiales bacterium]|nr:MAG: carboxymuconolactone decarboxylase [Acidimicrobiales bacterium]